MPPRVTQGMLERGVGGAPQLLTLADRDRKGGLGDPTAQAFIRDVLNDANGEVDSYALLAADSGDVSLQGIPILIRYELAVATYLAWLRGAGGMAIPKPTVDEYDRAMTELQKLADRKKGFGTKARPTAAQDVKQVTKSCNEPWFARRGPRRRFDGFS
jgi:hypothetical protein